MSSGVDDPPGVQNFSRCPARTPPAYSSSSRSVMPSGASYCPGTRDVAGQRIQRVAGRLLAAHRAEPFDAVENDRRHAGDRFDVVDHRGAAVEPGHRGERRPQPGLAPPAFQGVEQRGLLAADVGARAGVDHQLQVEAGAVDVAAHVTGRVGLGHRVLQTAQHRHHLAAHVDERVAGPDRVGGDDDALDEDVRRREHQRNVFARTGFRLVGVDHQVVRLGGGTGVALGDERPFRPGGESGTAAAAQPGVLDGADHRVGVHRQGLLQSLITLVAIRTFVRRQTPRLGVVPVPAEYRGQRCRHD